MHEFSETITNFCQNSTLMSIRKIKEFVNSSPSRVLIDKTHNYLLRLVGYICRLSQKEETSFNNGPAIATLKHYSLTLGKSARVFVLIQKFSSRIMSFCEMLQNWSGSIKKSLSVFVGMYIKQQK